MHFTDKTPKKENPKFTEGSRVYWHENVATVEQPIYKGLGMGFKYAITLDEPYNDKVNYIVDEKNLTKNLKQ